MYNCYFYNKKSTNEWVQVFDRMFPFQFFEHSYGFTHITMGYCNNDKIYRSLISFRETGNFYWYGKDNCGVFTL